MDEAAARAFSQPTSATHRQYEALRAYFVDQLPSAEVARRFGYTPGSFRVLCHQFRQNPKREFFLPVRKGLQGSPQRELLREKVIALRRQHLSISAISEALREEGERLSPAGIALILKQAGLPRLPRRRRGSARPSGGRR